MTLLRDTRDRPSVRPAAEPWKAFTSTTVNKAKDVARTSEQAITDRWITAKVKAYFVGPTLMPDVTVQTRDHVVTLKGNVPSSAERERAAGLARDTDGVTRVVNQLEVRKQ